MLSRQLLSCTEVTVSFTIVALTIPTICLRLMQSQVLSKEVNRSDHQKNARFSGKCGLASVNSLA